MLLNDGIFFASGSVVWNLQSTDKFDAIREVIHHTPVFRTVEGLDLGRLEETVIARENLQSTGFGHGVAIAHGRTRDIDGPRIALGVSRKGIEFHSIDGKLVHLLFVVATHPSMPMDYLQILASLVSLVRNDMFRSELLGCSCSDDVEQKLRRAFHTAMLQLKEKAQ